MDKETFDELADRAYKKTISEYEDYEKSINRELVITERDLISYIDQKVKNSMGHNERYTELLVKEIITYYENKN